MPPNPALVAAAIGVGVVGGFSSGRAARKAAKREAEYKRWLYEQAIYFGKDALARLTLATHTQRRQQNEILARNVEQAHGETLRQKGFIAASAAASGVAGASVALELAEADKALKGTKAGARLQKEFLDVGAELNLREGRMRILQQVISAYPSPTNVPSNASVALGAISSGLALGSGVAGLQDAF